MDSFQARKMVSSEPRPEHTSIADRPSAVDPASWSKQDIGLAGGSIVEPAASAFVSSGTAPTASRESSGWRAQSDSESHGPVIERARARTLSPQGLFRRKIRERVATLVAENSISCLVNEVNLRLSQYCSQHSEPGRFLFDSSGSIDDVIQWIGLLTTLSILEQEASASAHDAICLEDMPVAGPPSVSPGSVSVSPSALSLTDDRQLHLRESEIHFDGPPGPPPPSGGHAVKKKAGRGGVYKCASCRKAKIRVSSRFPTREAVFD